MPTLDELVEPQTEDAIKASVYADAAGAGLPTTTWKPGAVVRTIIAIFAKVLSSASSLQALIAKSGFLELSEKSWLTLVARHVYDVERDVGSFASGEVTVDNTGGGVYSGDAGDLVFLNSSSDKTYRNTASFSIGALETGVIIPIEAIEIGSDSTAAAGEIDALETTLLGVTVVGNAAAVVGTDPESDPDLRTRCREKTGVLSPNGPRDAYAFVARSAKDQDGNSIGVTRVTTIPDGVGGIDVYVATASGSVTGSAVDPATDLGAVADDIHTQAEPLAITPTVQSATPELIAVTYELWIRESSNLTEAEAEEAVEDALVTFMSGQPIGGTVIPGEPGRVYHAAIEATIASALPDGSLIDLDVTVPAGDVDLVVPEAPVLGTVIVTDIHLVAEGET